MYVQIPTPRYRPSFRAFGLAIPKLAVPDHLKPLLQRLGRAAGVVFEAGRGRVGEFVRPDQVLPPDVRRVHPEPAGGLVQELFLHHDSRGKTHAAVYGERRFVGADRLDLVGVVPDPIRSGKCGRELESLEGRRPRVGAVRTQVSDDPRTHSENRAVVGERHPALDDVVLGVETTQEAFATIFGPEHRRSQLPR